MCRGPADKKRFAKIEKSSIVVGDQRGSTVNAAALEVGFKKLGGGLAGPPGGWVAAIVGVNRDRAGFGGGRRQDRDFSAQQANVIKRGEGRVLCVPKRYQLLRGEDRVRALLLTC
jgi:hypothetical protein